MRTQQVLNAESLTRLSRYAQKPARRCIKTASNGRACEASRFASSMPPCLFKTSKARRFAYFSLLQASFVLKRIQAMDCLNHSRGLPDHERSI
jgi:hypothetical protein